MKNSKVGRQLSGNHRVLHNEAFERLSYRFGVLGDVSFGLGNIASISEKGPLLWSDRNMTGKASACWAHCRGPEVEGLACVLIPT
jgi:hypothetical protein